MGKNEELTAFSERLHEICDDMQIPRSGRQSLLAKEVGLSQNATRKWLSGEGLPTLSMCCALAKRANVNTEWLLTGRGDKQLAASNPATNALTAQEPAASRHYHVSALISAVEKLDPDDAKNLLPVVARIANSAPRSAAQPNSTNTRIHLSDDGDQVAAAQ